MAAGRNCRARDSPVGPFHGDDALETFVPRQAEEDARVMRVILDDEQHGIAVHDGVAVVLDVLLARDGQDGERARLRAAFRRRWGRWSRVVRAGVVQRQVERESAALAVDAGELDFAAEQDGQLAADGEAQAGAAVFARGAGVGLLEGLEDEPLLLRRDADAGVLDGEGQHLLRLAEHRVIRRSSRSRRSRRAFRLDRQEEARSCQTGRTPGTLQADSNPAKGSLWYRSKDCIVRLFQSRHLPRKGAKCKFSHDANVERKSAKIDLYTDNREDDQAKGKETLLRKGCVDVWLM